MPAPPQNSPSFTPRRRWAVGFDLALRTLLVLAVIVMLNYLGSRCYQRFYLSSQTRTKLSTRTLSVLHALTNQVAVTVYYDRQDPFYPSILALLNEYHYANPKITIKTVDYVRDAGEAAKVKEQYKLTSEKDLVIFDLAGKVQVVDGDGLIQYTLKNVKRESGEKELQFQKKAVSFSGETTFTSRLLALENSQPLKAYFLQGDRETSLTDSDQTYGYLTFGLVLSQNYLSVNNLELSGSQDVPADCSLLIIAAPLQPLETTALQKINRYLNQGGRLFVILDYRTRDAPTGLEPILQQWGINVLPTYIKDPDHTYTGQDIKVEQFNEKSPISSALERSTLHMIMPRCVARMEWQNPPPNAPEVLELAYSSPSSLLARNLGAPPQSYPVMASSEQKTVSGVTNPRGNTRIVAVGDSVFLGNYYLPDVANRDFVDASVNWLLERSSLVPGISPQNITEFRLDLTLRQQTQIRWILLAIIPGIIMAVGWLVWLARRK